MLPSELQSWMLNPSRPPLVMGVLNVTPDSFSDGGRFLAADAAIAHARQMVAEGADIIDVGAESTRPGATSISADEQIRRIVPVIQKVATLPVVVSIDTTRAPVAAAALAAGAAIVNDVSAGRDDAEMFPLVARRKVPIVLMHMLGTPQTMQDDPRYGDVVGEVVQFLRERTVAAQSAGVTIDQILLDPGIGFGKTVEYNLTLLRRQDALAALGRPLVIGTSRKGFIGKITNEPDPARRAFGTAATVAWSVLNGAAVLRVHDVAPMVQVIRMIRSIQDEDFLTKQ